MLADFYNKLGESRNFSVLSMFDQAIFVDDFKGDKRFYYNEEYETKNIKSLQLNKKAFEYHNINVNDGDIKWEDVQYGSQIIPVLLGADYKGLYQKGDIIDGDYYSALMQFEVAGFLEDNCTIKYNYVMEMNLDTYMLIPYPERLWSVQGDFVFESILYFAMINCDILPKVGERNIKSLEIIH